MERNPEDLICACGGPKSRQAPRCARCAGAGHTSEQRDNLSTPLCGAKKRDGSKCRAFAGQGTDHPGIGTCRWHGGATAAHKKHAVALDARQRMARFGTPIENISAPEALMGLLRASAGHVAFLLEEVTALDALASHEAQVIVDLYDRERDRLVRVSEACVRAGVAEHVISMEQGQAAMTVRAVRDAAGDVGLNRTQLQALGVALRKRLAEAAGGFGDPERAALEAEQADAKLVDLRGRIAAEEEKRITRAAAKRRPADLVYPPEEWIAPNDPAA